MTIQRANFADALAPGFRKIFIDALNFGEKPPVINKVYNMPKTPATQSVKDSYITGFGLASVKTEGTSTDYDDVYQGFDKTYTHDTYSIGYRVTKEMEEDDRYGLMGKLPKAAGRSVRATVETDGANMLNNGFSDSYLGADGLELFSTLHVLVTGGTQKNELTNAADLSGTSYEQALIDLAETTDDRGIYLNLSPKKIVFPVELDWTVQKLFGTPKGYGSGMGDINPAHNENLEYVKWAYLTDGEAWFILCDEHEANWFWRIHPQHYKGNDFDTDDAKFKARARWKRGYTAPWGLFGSPGG